MPKDCSQNRHEFPSLLLGGGITGELFRLIDWSRHPLGVPVHWPGALKTILNVLFHSQHPMFVWWGPELYQFYNDGYLPSFGIGKHPKAMGQRGEDCWPEIWSIIKPQIDQVMNGEGATWNENQYVPIFRNGKIEDVYWTYGYSPIFNEDGTIGGTLVVCTETTQQVLAHRSLQASRTLAEQAQKAAEKAMAEAERANHLKSIFLANMSHEIRTPIGAMLGFAGLLRDPDLSYQERMNYIDILCRNGENLSVIINDILDLSKVEAGFLTLEFIEIFPDQLMKDVLSILEIRAKEQGLNLVYIADETTPKSIISDPTRVGQVLLNLVGNAIKFTSTGSVVIRGFGKKSDDNRDVLCFHIIDTGIGIPENQKEKIFEMFVQVDGTMTRRFGGTGLGLALSRSLADSLGGSLSLTESVEGEGSTFLFTVASQPEKARGPTERHSRPDQENNLELPQSIDGLKILIVDDSPDNRKLVLKYLSSRGAIVDVADNGSMGCIKAMAGDYNIMLMDIQMPEMDGYTAAHRLRSQGYKKPIIALSAHAMGEIRQKCLNSGYTDHLSKPINFNQLMAVVAKYGSQ